MSPDLDQKQEESGQGDASKRIYWPRSSRRGTDSHQPRVGIAERLKAVAWKLLEGPVLVPALLVAALLVSVAMTQALFISTRDQPMGGAI